MANVQNEFFIISLKCCVPFELETLEANVFHWKKIESKQT